LATASAVQSTRPVSGKFFLVPHSFAEHQAALIPAERALALIVFRRAVNENGKTDMNGTADVPDSLWESWTGYAPRQKEYAIKGLKEKGLDVVGRGDTAKFSWDWNRWQQSYKNRGAIQSPNADPKRKEREAKAGAKVHEECHDHGCAMLRAGNCPGDAAQSTAEVAAGSKRTSGLFLTQVAQYTAQTVGETTEKAWAATMAALCSFFPMIGVVFLQLLLRAVRRHFPDVTDIELAQAVRLAYIPSQRGEGLFLTRVPRAVLILRQRKKNEETEHRPIIPKDEELRIARGIIQAVDAGDTTEPRWREADVEWAREVLFEHERRE